MRLLLLAALLLAGTATAQPADTLRLSIEEAIQRALQVSPEVDQVEAQQAFAEARSRFARANRFLTDFKATTAHALAPGLDNPNDTPTDRLYLDPAVRNDWSDPSPFNRLEVTLTQPLYTWGELGGSIRAARHGVAVEAAEVEGKALEVAVRTGEIYYGLLLADELYRLAAETGDLLEQARGEIQRLIDEGDGSVDDADLFQLRLTEQEYRRRVVEVDQRRRTARTALRRQLFLPETQVVLPTATALTPLSFALDTLDAYFAQALQHRPELAQAQAGLAARDALVGVARSGYFPEVFLAASATYAYAPGRYRQRNPYLGDPFLSRSLLAGLGVRQQLNFAQTKARVEQAEAERNEVRFQLEAAQQLVLFEVEDAYRNVIIAQAALEAQDEALRISKEWLRTEQINFDLDLGDTENLVKAVRENLELQARYYDAVQRYNVAVLRLLDATGTLTRRAQLGTLVD